MKEQKQVGIWVRVSTEDQAQGESPEHHEKHGRYYAESRKWNVVKVYRLNAISGKSVMSIAETKEMLQDIASGKITGLIFSKLARLARNTRELLDFADYFQEHNADLISLQEAIDTSSPAGRLFYTMVAAMAQWEREEIASRVAASVPIRAKLGKPLGGQAPFGYMWEGKELKPDPNEAPVRKLIYEMFVEHRRKKTIAKLMNEKGYRTRNGSKFSDTTIDRLLRDPTAKGIRRANYTKSTGQGKKWELKPEEEWVEIPVEPIVSVDLWERCNQILDEQRASRKKPTKKTAHLFSGFAFCQCGKKMYVPSKYPKYTCYKCGNKIRLDDLEEIFHSQLKNFFLSPKEIEGYLGQADKVIREKEQLRDSIANERKRVKSEMDKLYGLYLDEGISNAGFKERYTPLEERLRQIDDQMPEIQGEIDFLRIQYLSSDEILHEARDLYSRWNQLSFDEKKKIIETITEKITIGKGDIEINLCYIPSSWELVTKGQHTPMVALPFLRITLKAMKPPALMYPKTLKTIGDHLRKKRLDEGLFQREVAEIIGVDECTIHNWECSHSRPQAFLIPKIIEFLDYNPFGEGSDFDYPIYLGTFGDHLHKKRLDEGITQKCMAQKLGVSVDAIRDWEKNRTEPHGENGNKLIEFLGYNPH